jgi:hypothetical protein
VLKVGQLFDQIFLSLGTAADKHLQIVFLRRPILADALSVSEQGSVIGVFGLKQAGVVCGVVVIQFAGFSIVASGFNVGVPAYAVANGVRGIELMSAINEIESKTLKQAPNSWVCAVKFNKGGEYLICPTSAFVDRINPGKEILLSGGGSEVHSCLSGGVAPAQ